MIDDFNENRRLEAILRKVGFDVVGIITETSLSEQIVAFGPDVIVISGQSAKLSALSVAAKLKEHRTFQGQVILGFPSGVKITSHDLLKVRVDRILDAPFRPDALINNLAQLLKMDGPHLIEKLHKFHLDEGKNEDPVKGDLKIVKGEVAKESMEIIRNLPKEERYRRIARQTPIDISKTTFQKNSVRDHWNEVKKGWDFKFLEDLKKLKFEFAKALFSRAKK